MTISAVTGGRTHWPTLAELERLAAESRERSVTLQRDGDCRTGLDRIARGYMRSRGVCEVERHPADWDAHGKPAGRIRNGTMLDGTTPGVKSKTVGQRADVLFAFNGGVGTLNCREQAERRGIEVVGIAPIAEPHIWNMHHRWRNEQPKPPGLMYVGRSREHGGPSPLANPFKLDPKTPRAEQEAEILGAYRRWLWDRIKAGDRAVLAALDAITPETFLGCTCWPLPCHAKVLVDWWRWKHGEA